MGAISKHFYELTKNRTCQVFSHPWTESCGTCAWLHAKQVAVTNLKLFIPIAIWPLAMKWEDRDLSLLGKVVAEYAMLVANGFYISNMISGGACVFCKCFEEMAKGHSCRSLFHPHNPSCLKYSWEMTIVLLAKLSQLLLPFAIVPHKIITYDWSLLRQSVINYGYVLTNGLFVGCVVSGSNCLFCNLFGRLHYYFVILVPTFFATLLMFVMPPHIQMGHAIAIFNSAFETFVKRQENRLVTYVRTSKAAATFTFMLMSATILKYLRTNSSMFWFIQPTKINHNLELLKPVPENSYLDRLKQNLGANCHHKLACKDYLINGVKTNLKIGLVIEVVQALIKNFSLIRSNPVKLLPAIFKTMNFKMTKFLVAYVGIYRLTHCMLNRCPAISFEHSNILAGFAGGLSYWFLPIYNFYALAFSTLAQLIFHDQTANNEKFAEYFKNIPLAPLIYMFSLPYIFHHRIFDPSNVSRFCMKMMDVGSNLKSYHLGKKLFSLAYFGHV